MINNLDIIKPLLNFEEVGDFYMLYILKRKKDQPEGEKDNHQSVRTIKTYCIESLEYLDKRYDEIKQLCEMFKARAYIQINKQNHKDVAMNMITEIINSIQSGRINQKNVFDSVVGQVKMKEKRWIVDLDIKDSDYLFDVMTTIKICRPEGNKIVEVIDTKNGYHLITERFDVQQFAKFYPDIDIQKKNPTLLFLPNSLSL